MTTSESNRYLTKIASWGLYKGTVNAMRSVGAGTKTSIAKLAPINRINQNRATNPVASLRKEFTNRNRIYKNNPGLGLGGRAAGYTVGSGA